MTYQEQIKAIEDYMDASLGVNGEITKRAEEAVKEMKAASGDTISRQAAIDALNKLDVSDGVGISSVACNLQEEAIRSIENLPSAQSEPSTEIQEILDYLDNTLHPIVSPDNWNVYCELHDMVSKLPSVQSDHIAEVSKKDIPSIFPTQMSGTSDKQVSILADALGGCPQTNPCDKLWAPHGWCEEHCGENQEPSKECWLKYAEVMASE